MLSPSVSQVVRATCIPAFVKSAKLIDEGDYDFGTRESTYISFVRALVKQASGDQLQSCIDHAKFWGIEPDCASAKAKFAEIMHAPELTDSDYALVFCHGGTPVKKFASYDAPTVVAAATSFYEQREDFPYALRAHAATALLNKTAAFKAVLPTYVHRYLEKAAAFGAFGIAELEDALILRDQACTAEAREQFGKVAALIEDMIESECLRTDHDFIKSAMTVIDDFDVSIDYNGTLIEEAVSDGMTLSALQKVASEQRFMIKLMNGCELDVRALKKVALSAVDPALTKLSEDELIGILPTLPRNDADLLSRLI